MVFENAYESSITFQPLLYANVPAESPSYAPTFFPVIKKDWSLIVMHYVAKQHNVMKAK